MEDLVNEKVMAAMLCVSVSTIQKDRFRHNVSAGKSRIPFIKAGRSVLYQPSLVFTAIAAGKAAEAEAAEARKAEPTGLKKRVGRPAGPSNNRYSKMAPDLNREVAQQSKPQPKPRAPLTIRPPRPDELPLCNKRPRPRGVAFTQLWERIEIEGESR